MTSLIIIGICIVSIIIHLTIGHLAALKLAPKVAELSVRNSSKITKDGVTIYEYEWENNRIRESSEYCTQWLSSNWKPTDTKKFMWKKTGNSRKIVKGEEKESIVTSFDEDWFRGRMALIRHMWFLGVPVTLSNSVDTKMIEKYDPSVAERKAKQQDARIKELEKELEI